MIGFASEQRKEMLEQLTLEQILIMGGAGFLVLLGLILWVIARGQRADSGQDEALAALKAHIDGLREQQIALQAVFNDRLDSVSQRVGQGLNDSAEKTAKSLGALQERLKVIDKAQENITKLSGDVIGLQDILSNKQARGAFGEIQLEDLVRTTMPPNAYEFQATLSNGKRPDCLIRLPNPPGNIVIDAKFPLESYNAIQRAGADDDAQARRAFAADILKHVKDITERYIIPGETAETAMMFVPSEAVHAELYANFEDTVRRAYAARVVIVSPTTLFATLNTMRAVLRDAQMREQAGLIQQAVANLMVDINRLDDRVGNLQRHFQQAEKDINEIQTSSRKISRQAERIEEIDVEESAPGLNVLTGGKG